MSAAGKVAAAIRSAVRAPEVSRTIKSAPAHGISAPCTRRAIYIDAQPEEHSEIERAHVICDRCLVRPRVDHRGHDREANHHKDGWDHAAEHCGASCHCWASSDARHGPLPLQHCASGRLQRLIVPAIVALPSGSRSTRSLRSDTRRTSALRRRILGPKLRAELTRRSKTPPCNVAIE